MCVADGAVEDPVGEGGLADDIVPFLQRLWDGDQAADVVVSVLDDFEEIAPLIGIEAFLPSIVEYQEIGLGKAPEQAGVAATGSFNFQFRRTSLRCACRVRRSHPGRPFDPVCRRAKISDAAWAGDDQVLFACYPFARRQLLEQGFIEAPGRAVIDIFDRSVRMAQAGV